MRTKALSAWIVVATIVLSGMGTTVIAQEPTDYVHRWALTEGTGTTAADSGGTISGTISGATWTPASGAAGSLSFDGADDNVEIPALNLNTDTMTITAWIKIPETVNDWCPVYMTRAGTSVSALNLRQNRELRYHWNASKYNWGSGLYVPADRWVFVAVAVEPTKATMFMHDGELKSAVNTSTHVVEAFDGVGYLGRDGGIAARHFTGAMADVRIYNRALTAAELQSIHAAHIASDTVAPTSNLTLAENPGWVVALDLNAADNFEIANTKVYRDNVLMQEVAGPLATYRDTSVAASTAYSYHVVLTDQANNVHTSAPLAVTTGGTTTFPSGVTGKVILKQFFEGSGSSMSGLTSHPRYPDTPYTGLYLTQLDAPRNVSDDGYGSRMEGWISPTTTDRGLHLCAFRR